MLLLMLIIMIPFIPIQVSETFSPFNSACSVFTGAVSIGQQTCTAQTFKGDLLVAMITCEGCSIAANPIVTDSASDVWTYIADQNCCGGTGAGEIGAIEVANASSNGIITFTGQIRDSANRTFWGFTVSDVINGFVSHKIAQMTAAQGSNAFGQTPINTASTANPNASSSLIMESATSNNYMPNPTTNFTPLAGNSGNEHAWSINYTTTPTTLPMGAGATTFGEQAVMIPITGLVTVTITKTLTGWQFPSFSNCTSGSTTCGNTNSWLYGFIVWLIPMAMIDVTFIKASPNVDRGTLIFLSIIGLQIGAIMGAMLHFLPLAVPFVMGIVFALYLWKGRG